MKRTLALIIITFSAAAIYLYIKTENAEEVGKSPDVFSYSAKRQEQYISPIAIEYLRSVLIDSAAPATEEELKNGSNYKRYIASYYSEGNKIYGLLTVPLGEPPDGGFPAIIFNHGYIPPSSYVTTQGYIAYVDYLARNGFVVFKIDFRGNGRSEGDPSGSYFSSAYTIDAISALKSLQKLGYVNSGRIGMWGHSMSGNVVLRSMLVSSEVKAGVIWAGAVYSYEDFVKYGISDNSYVHRPSEPREGREQANRETSEEIQKIRNDPGSIDFSSDFWKSISLTQNINYLNRPIQLHHAVNDDVVDIGYTRDLESILKDNDKDFEIIEYEGGGHNITSPYFEKAMENTVRFFKENL